MTLAAGCWPRVILEAARVGGCHTEQLVSMPPLHHFFSYSANGKRKGKEVLANSGKGLFGARTEGVVWFTFGFHLFK